MHRLFQWTVFCVGVCVGVVGLMVATSVARDVFLDSSPRMIPYNGLLAFDAEGDGVAQNYTGQVDLEVTLADEANNLWTETHLEVSVHRGRFTLLLGSIDGAEGVPPWLFNAEEVVLDMAVKRAGSDEPFVPFDRRQRITPAMFALWAAEAHQYRAIPGGALRVARDAHVNGNVSMSSLQANVIEGTLTVTNTVQLDVGEESGLAFSSAQAPDFEASLRLVDDIQDGTFLTFASNSSIRLGQQGLPEEERPIMRIADAIEVEGMVEVENLDLNVSGLFLNEGIFVLDGHETSGRLFARLDPVETTTGSVPVHESARHFCPLSAMETGRVDGGGTTSRREQCKVTQSGGNYSLVLSDAVSCGTVCLRW